MDIRNLMYLKAILNSTNKNLLDPSLIETGYYSTSGVKTEDGNDEYRRFAITLPAGEYTFNTDLPECYIVRVHINNSVVSGSSGLKQTYSFELEEEAEVKFSFRRRYNDHITDPFYAEIVAA